jgi:hypothetical protein
MCRVWVGKSLSTLGNYLGEECMRILLLLILLLIPSVVHAPTVKRLRYVPYWYYRVDTNWYYKINITNRGDGDDAIGVWYYRGGRDD